MDMCGNKVTSDSCHWVVAGDEWNYRLTFDVCYIPSAYGIEISDRQNGTVAFALPGVSEDEILVKRMLLLMSDENVEPCHALDVIQDFIANYYTMT